MNAKLEKRFECVAANLDLIVGRIKERHINGTSLEDVEQLCKSVIVVKWRQWQNDDEMGRYLRPGTIFAKRNFAQYVGELHAD